MEIDVFTLFPEAFAWFVSQRHVVNALAIGHRLECVNYRDHTPLGADPLYRQVTIPTAGSTPRRRLVDPRPPCLPPPEE